jgi:galactonate dehydratase
VLQVDEAIAVSDALGLGVEIVEEKCAEHPGCGNVAGLPPDDGWAYEPGTVAEAVCFQTHAK